MNEKTYRVLEYDKIKELLKEEAGSQMTKEMIDKLLPSSAIYEVKTGQAETTEAVTVIMRKGALSLGSFYDIGGLVNLADKGGVLTMRQLLEVLYNLQSARRASSFLKSDLPRLPVIDKLVEVISLHKSLEEDIDRSIISEDEMADNASPELRQIRRKIGQQNESIRSKMNSILSSSNNRTMLQDAIVTMRQGRYVIPVKQEHKTRFPGIVHDQSATGATLFIEPQAIVNMNNELRELELAEKKEMQRILAELSAAVAESGEEIVNNQKILLQLDFIFAKGRLSVKQKAVEPGINTKDRVVLKEARHPLIDPKKVVPITVSIGKDYDTLVITGPNTGGKTVTLKTVGLLALMAQSGLHVPCGSGSELPLFKKVYADIGDEQSIEQSLSTFSSHMTNIVEIVKDCEEGTLVLLDELGAGTDPTEGAALAISILDRLAAQGAKTLATTHYTELKKYAIATSGVENASMEFNVETLSPTYKLSIGIPGRSNAFEISLKLGLDESIITYAKGLMEVDDIAFEDVIVSIEKDRKAAEEERDEAIALNLAMKKQKEELDLKAERLAEKKDKILSRAREEAREMLAEAKEALDQAQKELREMEKFSDPAERRKAQEGIRRKIRETSDGVREELPVPKAAEPVKPWEVKVGDRVKVLTLDQKGTVTSVSDDGKELMVQAGALKISVSIDNISKIQEQKPLKAPKRSRYMSMYTAKAASVPLSVNVVGKNLDEAEMIVSKYLDDACMAGLKEVTVIHGRGAGILREGLGQMFKSHKHVAKSRRGSYNEGGDGVTVVTLR